MGVIPEDWDIARLGTLAHFRTGPFGSALHKSDYVYGGVPVINPMQIVDGKIVNTPRMAISEAAAQSLSEFRLLEGDIIIGRRGEMGRCAVVQLDQSGWLCGTGSMIVRPNVRLESRFAQRMLSSLPVIAAIEATSVGSTMINLNQSTLNNLQISLPPTFAEQQAIAETLNDADALIDSMEKMLAKKRQVKQGAMQALLTGQIRLGGFDGEWKHSQLKQIVQTPITDGPHMTPKFQGDGVPFLSVNNLVNNRIDFSDLRFISTSDHEVFSKKCRPRKGDILLGKAASVGKVALVESDIDFNIWSPIAMIRVSSAYCSRFIYYQLQSTGLARQIALLTNSSSQGNIGMGDIERLVIGCPQYDEQIAISAIISSHDDEIKVLETRLQKARHLKQGMMQELLTGRIRLV